MPRLSVRVPTYRLHKPSGRAVVTLNGRDVYLGAYGSPQSKAEYNRIVAEWQLSGRSYFSTSSPIEQTISIDEVIAAYLEHARHYYIKNGKPTKSQDEIRWSLSPLHEQYGSLPTSQFGPLALKAFRHQLIEHGRWSRSSINRAVGVIKRMFKWAAENELISIETHQRLQTVSGLRRGRTAARETEPVRPVPEEQIEATVKHVAKPVAAMIQLQRYTGMRPAEVITMRLSEIDRSARTWVYTPLSHKTEHHGRSRRIFLGPRAQRTLIPLLKKNPNDFLFSPREADTEHRQSRRCRRKTPLSCGNRRGTNRKCRPKRTPGDRFTVKTYRAAITRACRHAYPPPQHLAKIKVPGLKGMR